MKNRKTLNAAKIIYMCILTLIETTKYFLANV